jgi:two-component system chemotaxis sensor kinase CheA
MFFSDDQLQEAIKEFRDEGLDLLTGMEEGLMAIRESGIGGDRINSVFRAAHTIKGSAGMLKLEHLVEFTHIAENLLDEIRNNKITIDDMMIDTFFQCKDHMQTLVVFYAENTKAQPDDSIKSVSRYLMGILQTYLNAPIKGIETVSTPSDETQNSKKWKIEIVFNPDIYALGMDPANFIRYLSKIGEIVDIQLDTDRIGDLDRIHPSDCLIGCVITFESDKTAQEISDVFEFVKDDVELKLTAIDSEDKVSVENPVHEEHESKVESAPSLHVDPSSSLNTNNKTTIIGSSSLRVDSDKIDTLINLIGEMVIANANVVQRASLIRDGGLNESVSAVSRMLEEIRESAMKIRMVQIGETFGKFKRIVHDVSKKLNKDVDLIINGGETEMDKTIVEKISDPLVHIVRNAMDHGLESTEERIAKGKPPKGMLTLNAYHDAGTIAIEIIDDGKGLDEERIYQKALERGIIDENTKLTQKEIFNLIFEAGFSTADAVTDLSGRGVGMDVVRRNIEALRGSVDIKSAKDKGSTFTMRLPLTLAIIDGFLVKVGSTHFVIPLDMVVECIELSARYRNEMHGNNYINLRNSILPLLNVRNHFNESGERKNLRENIIVVQYAGMRFGLIVEELHGEFQTVIKPLGRIFREIRGISGSTILGSGEVALILDIPILMNHIVALQAHNEKGGADEVKED